MSYVLTYTYTSRFRAEKNKTAIVGYSKPDNKSLGFHTCDCDSWCARVCGSFRPPLATSGGNITLFNYKELFLPFTYFSCFKLKAMFPVVFVQLVFKVHRVTLKYPKFVFVVIYLKSPPALKSSINLVKHINYFPRSLV